MLSSCSESESLGQQVDLLQEALRHSRVLTDSEKYYILTTAQDRIADEDLDTRYFGVTGGGRKRKQITFQRRWLQDYSWLRYGHDKDHQEGWCLPCVLFLTESEKAQLGAFVCTPFTNYNKSKEICEKHGKKEYHLRAVDRAYNFKKTWLNPERRIDSRLIDINDKNFKFNSEVLPSIVEAVVTCAKQIIALRGHQQDKIDFGSPPTHNEGNFIAILRLIAKNNPTLKEHLISGPRNAKYTSKTIQNEILEIAANQIQDFYRRCIQSCPHFSHMADEVTSNGKEISVCVC